MNEPLSSYIVYQHGQLILQQNLSEKWKKIMRGEVFWVLKTQELPRTPVGAVPGPHLHSIKPSVFNQCSLCPVCVKTQQKHACIKHGDKTKQ